MTMHKSFLSSLLLSVIAVGTGVLVGPALGPSPQQIAMAQAGDLEPFAYESITVDNTSGGKGFTAATYAPAGALTAKLAFCTAEAAAVGDTARYTVDGTAPTTSVGHLIGPNIATPVDWAWRDGLRIVGRLALRQFRAIRVGSNSVTLRCTYYR